ncbi:MAG: hypothetical protein AB1746_04410 [Candidatus Zixiibacteriota bacterium]
MAVALIIVVSYGVYRIGMKGELHSMELRLKLLEAEQQLSGQDGPYLIIDFSQSRMTLRLRGATVRSIPMELISKPEEIGLLIGGDADSLHLVHYVKRAHLYEGLLQLSDTVLNIVSEATNAPPERIQRYKVGKLAVTWDGGIQMKITTDLEGKSFSQAGNIIESGRSFLENYLGTEIIEVKVSSEDATALYGALDTGLPVIFIQ